EDTTAGRIKLLVEPHATLRVVLGYEAFRMDQDAAPWFLQHYNPLNGPNAAIAAQGTRFGPVQNFVRGVDFDKAMNGDPQHTYAKTETYTGVAEWEVGFGATVKAILGRRLVYHNTIQDLDGTPYVIQTSVQSQKVEQNSAELQLIGT